jgi:hypothetical protein
MMGSLDEVINQFEKIASDYEFNLDMHQHNVMKLSVNDIERMKRYAQENRQLAEWLRELKIHREIHNVLLQFMADSDLDICCDELMNDENEKLICEENCENQTKNCWVRWAKLKAREKNDADSD